MYDVTSIEAASNAVRKLWEKHGIQQPLRFLGFCLSMLPVPLIQQAGQALDRHLGDKSFNEELARIWNEIKAINDTVTRVETLEESFTVIAETIKDNRKLFESSHKFINDLGTHQAEFTVLTEDESYQELLKSIVKAKNVTILSRGKSTTLVEDTKFSAEKSHLHATGGSHNYFRDTTFEGINASTSLHKVSQVGHVGIEGNTVSTYAEGPNGGAVQAGQILGMMAFGPNGMTIGTPSCPNCNAPLFSAPNGSLCKICNRIY